MPIRRADKKSAGERDLRGTLLPDERPDAIRPNAAEAIRTLHGAGIDKVVMLSGDNQRTADAIARQAGIDEAHGDLPGDKIARIRELTTRFHFVGMIGDGVNDAPQWPLRASASQWAMPPTPRLKPQTWRSCRTTFAVADAIILGRRTVRIIPFNIAFALALKALFLILALLGHASLWLAILADTGATLIVIANALRLLRA